MQQDHSDSGTNTSLSVQQFDQLFGQMMKKSLAGLYASTVGQQAPVRYITLALDTAVLAGAPRELGCTMQSLVVLGTTDPTVSVNIRLSTQDTSNDSFPLKNNAQIKLPFPVSKVFLDWPAQPGKTISFLVMTIGEFSTNQLVSSLAAQVTTYTGSTVTQSAVVLAAATATILFPLDTTRKSGTWRNESGADVWVGNISVSNTGANRGLHVLNGDLFSWTNTAALYAYSVAGSTETILVEN